ncbi:MAG: hypothetical protein QN209_09795 [Armatimonadota bacterium]|nr:hypothetical protein [Armatimonadota bacterium]MDR7464971.1 hypothetical protein [Armatimonadota bacterium]
MASDPFARDAQVLPHLRGYPEELRHFSNLIKHSHPQGRSALESVLRRPAASDSYIANLCRLVAAGEAVLSVVEAAERFGVSPQTFLRTIAARPDFPPPLFAREEKRLWRAGDVEAYIQRRGEAPPAGDL